MIRKATIDDLARLTEIYNQAIESRNATADIEPLTTEQRKPWLKEHLTLRTPAYVFTADGQVVGYCTLSAYRAGRKGLESVAEVSYYIDRRYHRRGIGSLLLAHAIQEAKKLGYRNLLAILLSCNAGSIALLEKHGFKNWGTLPGLVRIDDRVYDHLYYGLNLQP